MCKPQYYAISYEINPWMSVQRAADIELAKQQWQALEQTILHCGAEIEQIPPAPGLPDLVFTANCGMRVGRQVYLSRFKYRERQKEREIFKQWFMQHHYDIIPEPAEFFAANGDYVGPCFEGAGDALFLGNVLFSAHGFRSDQTIYPAIQRLLDIRKTVTCELVAPQFYHLDTCFCPLSDHQALWFPPAFSPASQERMKKAANLYAIPIEEERSFACNAVIIGRHAIIPDQCPRTRTILEKLQFTVYECAMSEFIKSGGACKCLTFTLSP